MDEAAASAALLDGAGGTVSGVTSARREPRVQRMASADVSERHEDTIRPFGRRRAYTPVATPATRRFLFLFTFRVSPILVGDIAPLFPFLVSICGRKPEPTILRPTRAQLGYAAVEVPRMH